LISRRGLTWLHRRRSVLLGGCSGGVRAARIAACHGAQGHCRRGISDGAPALSRLRRGAEKLFFVIGRISGTEIETSAARAWTVGDVLLLRAALRQQGPETRPARGQATPPMSRIAARKVRRHAGGLKTPHIADGCGEKVLRNKTGSQRVGSPNPRGVSRHRSHVISSNEASLKNCRQRSCSRRAISRWNSLHLCRLRPRPVIYRGDPFCRGFARLRHMSTR